MATKYHYFTGTTKFSRLNKPDTYGNYAIKVEMDEDNLAKYRASGIACKIEENAVFFRRPQQKLIKNELVTLGPPGVDDDEKKPVTALLGSGSKVTVKVHSYDTVKGTGHTLDHIRVHELVPVDGAKQDEYYDF